MYFTFRLNYCAWLSVMGCPRRMQSSWDICSTLDGLIYLSCWRNPRIRPCSPPKPSESADARAGCLTLQGIWRELQVLALTNMYGWATDSVQAPWCGRPQSLPLVGIILMDERGLKCLDMSTSGV
ncbi:hypothetical protein GE21DRAFT_8009 [Neurospora crassa]|uniref:Uncharacterized protein n=1 Tax=Neurospora crassa (strain ATCC 24698 / 74-OR23-1A / CBS 708.71 / DSM 1257 / FGSC 987) TaxID=367110 RepID=V5IN91_NEUCR|nr:hypothetical protein NCU17016 [Neurospora crassa OR74A]ESA42614.1 hypothetical protein NCU17016 [Neurospora crassa OR74A]KHE83644.1 hypothetical protein GE21DRAFT_8009 [Neurospora crassa]|eukprot:XP_011394841.1 hypothetical protein NCU17016 [Neurospora crassa OR74A]